MFKLVENSLKSILKRLSVSLQALKMPQDSDDQEKDFFLRYKNNLHIRSERWIKELKLLPELAKDGTLFYPLKNCGKISADKTSAWAL